MIISILNNSLMIGNSNKRVIFIEDKIKENKNFIYLFNS